MYSPYTPEKFESEWKRVVDNCDVSNNRWVNKTYQLKRMWASVYMRDHFLCGVRTTSICEGVNSFIKKYVRHKNSIVDFLHNFERALKEYRHNELLSDFKSFYYHPMLTTALSGFELEASKIFTSKKFKVVKKAIEDVAALSVTERADQGDVVAFKVNIYRKKDVVFWVYLDKLQTKFLCDCRRFERRGLPCSHIICAMKYEDMDMFPESLICKRWTKTAKSDHISSLTSQEGNDEKMSMFRRGALAAAFNSLCDVSCKSESDYKEALEGIYSLCNKINTRHEGNGHGKQKANKSFTGDPLMVNAKGAHRSKKSTSRTRCCSNCRLHGHTIRKCPELGGAGVVFEDQEKEASPIESDNESKSLSGSMSNDMNDDIHSVAVSNGGHDVEKSNGTKRKRECDNVAFSTQDYVNRRKTKTNRSTIKGDACVTPNTTINIDSNGMTHGFGYENSTLQPHSHCASWNHSVGYGFTMHNGIPNNGGSVFTQFPPRTILSSHSNTILHTRTHNVSSNTPFMSVMMEVERSAKCRNDYCGRNS